MAAEEEKDEEEEEEGLAARAGVKIVMCISSGACKYLYNRASAALANAPASLYPSPRGGFMVAFNCFCAAVSDADDNDVLLSDHSRYDSFFNADMNASGGALIPIGI